MPPICTASARAAKISAANFSDSGGLSSLLSSLLYTNYTYALLITPSSRSRSRTGYSRSPLTGQHGASGRRVRPCRAAGAADESSSSAAFVSGVADWRDLQGRGRGHLSSASTSFRLEEGSSLSSHGKYWLLSLQIVPPSAPRRYLQVRSQTCVQPAKGRVKSGAQIRRAPALQAGPYA